MWFSFKHRFCHTVSSPPWHIYKPWQTNQKFFGLYHWILLAEGWKVVMGLSLLPCLPLKLSAKSRNTTNLSVSRFLKCTDLRTRVNGSVENQGEADTSLVTSGHHCPDTLHTAHAVPTTEAICGDGSVPALSPADPCPSSTGANNNRLAQGTSATLWVSSHHIGSPSLCWHWSIGTTCFSSVVNGL